MDNIKLTIQNIYLADVLLNYLTRQRELLEANLSGVMHYCGSVKSMGELPSSPQVGDTWNVERDYDGQINHNYAWSGTGWDDIGGTVDLSNYLTKKEAENKYALKETLQDFINNYDVDVLKKRIDTLEEVVAYAVVPS